MRTVLFILGAALVTAEAGCGRLGSSPGVSDSTFVATMAALQVITNDPVQDSAAKAAARGKVLQEQGLTPERLERAARALAADPDHAAALWARIDSTAQQLSDSPR
ncbi:MAG: hypothetical protein M3373_03790 [Gemmatimonadota bacterium]|nr:hypothetical protein [Gemmatimonadota bacterium]